MNGLSAEQLQSCRESLQRMRDRLQETIRQDLDQVQRDNLANMAAPGSDAGDQSFVSLVTDVDQAMASRHSATLADIEAAMVRLDDGSYGECVDCESVIGAERLQVEPTAIRCIGCQSAFERLHAGTAGPTL